MKKFIPVLLWLILLSPLLVTAQTDTDPIINSTLNGKVVDGKSSNPLSGAVVKIKGTTHEVLTDNEGKFNFKTGQKFPYVLVVSYVGYESNELTANGGFVEISLKEKLEDLDEVVIVGYTQQKRSSLTGIVSKVSAGQISNLHGSGFNEKLQGTVPGLQISSGSGVEGGSVFVRLRGTTSINAGNDPLYIIDGVFINSSPLQSIRTGGQTVNPLADINPNDIERIEVLKDANATAIYGARGANGVILITTKRGSKAGKTKINFDAEYGFAHYDKLWDLTTGPQHAEVINEAHVNDGKSFASRPYRPKSEIVNGQAGLGTPEEQGTYDRLHLMFRTGNQQNYNLSATGGNEKTSFYIGGGYSSQESILELQDFSRLGFRANVDHTLNKKIVFGISASYNVTKRQLARTGDTGGILNTGLHTPTLTPIFNADGTYNTTTERFNNPYILLENSDNYSYGKHFIGNGYLKWKILPNLSFKTSWSVDDNTYIESVYYNANLTEGRSTNGSATDATTNDRTWTAEQLLNYNANIGGASYFSVFVGNTLQKNQYENSRITGTNFPSTEFTTISSAAITSGTATGIRPSGLISYFGGANFNLKNKYIIDANLRTDASSRFGKSNQWASFPSAGISWRISQENLFKDHIRAINELRLRASIGWTGNQGIPDFASLGLWSGGNNYLDRPGIAPSQLGNDDLKWETTRQWNLGLQATLFRNRLRIDFNYYDKYTTDLLLQVPTPGKTGFSSTFQNLGEMSNKGFEFEISSTNISKKDFEWTTSFNISRNKNLIEKLPSSFTQYNRDWVRLEQGYSMYSFWLYKQLYVDPQTGNAVYDDSRTKDGKITTSDRQIVGSAFPDYYGGLNNSIRYKNFDFNFFIYFSQGNQVFNMNRYFQEHAGSRGTSWSLLESQMRRWQKPGDITDIPRITTLANADGSYNHNYESSRFMEDGSFIRLRNVALGYSLPRQLLSRIGIQRLRVYVNATNLLTLTNYSGADPEVNTAQDYANSTVQGLDFSMPPHPRTINFGINLTF